MPLDPFATFLLGCLAVILFGIAVLVATLLTPGSQDPSRHDSLNLALTVAGWVLIVLGLAATILALLPFGGLAMAVAAVAVGVETLVKNRLSKQYALLWLLTVAAERLIPLVPAVEAFGREGGGSFGRRARWLAEMLRAGVALPDALERLPGLLSPDVLAPIRVGYESGALAATLRQVASVRNFQRPLWLMAAGRLVYLGVVVFVGVAIMTFLMYRIVPVMQDISWDFDAELPQMTQLLIAAADQFAAWWFLLAPFFAAIGLLFVYVLLRYAGLVYWELPGTNWLVRRLDTASILETLAVAAEHRRPLPEVFATLARSYHKASIRGRLRGVVTDLGRGADWLESLFARGLIRRADLAILQAAGRAGNLPWALREMAESNRRRLAYRLNALVQLAFPPCVLFLAAVVMFIVVGLFIPLITLTESLVSW